MGDSKVMGKERSDVCGGWIRASLLVFRSDDGGRRVGEVLG